MEDGGRRRAYRRIVAQPLIQVGTVLDRLEISGRDKLLLRRCRITSLRVGRMEVQSLDAQQVMSFPGRVPPQPRPGTRRQMPSARIGPESDAQSGRAEFVCERPELGDLNVIIQVEEWHSSDRFGGTVRARESGHLGPESGVRCR